MTDIAPSRSGLINGHEWVDMGLSVKWATCNVGALSPLDFGYYFAWGETKPKTEYSWENYKFRESGDSCTTVTFNKYNTLKKRGRIDNKTRLDRSDDAAQANWGGTWRMPTRKEIEELKNMCIWDSFINAQRLEYFKVTSKITGNSIFIPAGGYWDESGYRERLGFLWLAAIEADDPRTHEEKYLEKTLEETRPFSTHRACDTCNAIAFSFNYCHFFESDWISCCQEYRFYGLPVRAVSD